MKVDILGYREKLANHIAKTSSLVSISELPPEKWIIGNYKANEYRTALFKTLYPKEGKSKFDLKRITLVDNRDHFDEYIEKILLEKINMHLHCYLNDASKREKLEELKNTIKEKIFQDTYAIFSSIHSSITDSYLIWKDEIEKNEADDLLTKCLTFGSVRYHEVLIYDDSVLFVKHENIENQEKDTKITLKYTSSSYRELYLKRWEELKDGSVNRKLGITLKDYVDGKTEGSFWKEYNKFDKLDSSLRDSVIRFFSKVEKSNIGVIFYENREKIYNTWKRLYNDNKDDNLNSIVPWDELQKFIEKISYDECDQLKIDFMLKSIVELTPKEITTNLNKIKKQYLES